MATTLELQRERDELQAQIDKIQERMQGIKDVKVCGEQNAVTTKKTSRSHKVLIEKEKLKEILRRENELRLSEEYQEKFFEAEKTAQTDWMEVVADLQKRVLIEFGIENIEKGLYELRTAASRYPEDLEFKEISLWVKYNRNTVAVYSMLGFVGKKIYSFFSFDHLYFLQHLIFVSKRAKQGDLEIGDSIPNLQLYSLNKEPVYLHDYFKEKPVVICAASYSWGFVPFIHEILESYGHLVDFLTVYILEAHAKDEWPINSSRYNNGIAVSYNQPKTIEERINIAKDFINNFNFKLPMIVDTIENDFENVFSW